MPPEDSINKNVGRDTLISTYSKTNEEFQHEYLFIGII
jgi:hypothetical protein